MNPILHATPGPLSKKRILLVSPQPWAHIKISKHHYAEVLGQENAVFFLNPPTSSLQRGEVRLAATAVTGVTEVNWMPRTPARLHRISRAAYTALIARDIAKILRAIGGPPDILWCFDCGRYPDLRSFKSELNILHVVDPIGSDEDAKTGRTADLIISVSNRVLAEFQAHGIDKPAYFINHGVSAEFLDLARQRADQPEGPRLAIQCGYFGNLDFEFINSRLIGIIADENPTVTFNFWGPSSKTSRLRTRLQSSPNCIFHGALPKTALARAAADMDCFIIAYDDTGYWDRSNSHKILEYLATGKVIIATRMDVFAQSDMLVMSKMPGDADFPECFATTLSNLQQLNSSEAVQARKEAAMDASYEKQVERIAMIIEHLKSEQLNEGHE